MITYNENHVLLVIKLLEYNKKTEQSSLRQKAKSSFNSTLLSFNQISTFS